MSREYKDSGIEWIGKIPKEWKTCQLKRLLSFQNGQDYKHVESESGFPVYGSGGVFRYANQFLYDGEAVLFGRKGTVDRPLYVNEKFWTVDTMYYAIPLDNANGKYIYYLSTQLPFDKYQTSTALPSMTQNILGNISVVIPNLLTQQKIADHLDKVCGEVDELISLQETMIEELKAYKQSVITEAVTKGLNPNVPMKDSGIDWIGEIPEHWGNSAPLKWFVSIILGKMLQSNSKNSDDSLEYYICAKDVHFEGIEYSDLKRMYFSPEEKLQYKVQKGDMLVVEGGAGAAGASIVKKDLDNVYIQNSIMIARPVKNVDISFVYYSLYSLASRGYVDYVCNKATIPHFTKEKLSRTIITFPPLDEQRSIASYLNTKCSEIDSLIALKQTKIEELKEYKKSVIYEYVTGKKEVVGKPKNS